MKAFDVHIPTRLLFGDQQESKFIKAIFTQGKKVTIVIGGGSMERLGYLKRVSGAIEKNGGEVQVFRGIEPNPHANTIDKAAEEARTFGTEVFVALGGGSVMDATKCIAALAKSGEKNIWPFTLGNEKRGQLGDALPIAAIPTTAATASEVTPYAVVSNPETNGKEPIAHPTFKPFVAWLNPDFTTKLPATTTQDGASDILSHVFENYLLGGNDSPIADRYSEGIIETVMDTLPRVLADPENADYRGRLLWASSLALNGMQQAGRNPGEFVMHSMEHALSGFYPELAHGRGLATLYPAYFRWLIQQNRAIDRLALLGQRIFRIQDENTTECAIQFVDRFEGWLRENNLLQSLSDLGIPEDRFDEIAEYAVAVYGRNGVLNALGDLPKEEIVRIFKATEAQTLKV